MADEILLISEDRVKETVDVSDNVAGKYILTSIREAQEIYFKRIIGTELLTKCKELVAAGVIRNPDNAAYKALIDESQLYLAYMTAVQLHHKVAYKIANAGIVKTPDDKVINATDDERDRQQQYYQSMADACAYELQGWILERYRQYPELTENKCHEIKANLYSAATCGLWLGGARGRRVRG